MQTQQGSNSTWKWKSTTLTCLISPDMLVGYQEKFTGSFKRSLVHKYQFLNVCITWDIFQRRWPRSFPKRRIWELAKGKQWSKALKYTLNSFKSQCEVPPVIVVVVVGGLNLLILTKENKYFVHNMSAVFTRPVALSSLFFLLVFNYIHNPTKVLTAFGLFFCFVVVYM